MAAAALVLYAVYVFVALVLRAFIQRRRTGDWGIRLGTEAIGSPAWWARITFVASLTLGAAAPVLDLTGIHEPLAALEHDPVALAGLVGTLASIGAVFVAQLTLGASWRVGVDPDERTELVVHWPYTVVRNPIFSAMLACSLGLALMVPSPMALAGFALLVWSIRYQVLRVEEPYLQRVHGAAYDDYRRRVGRFVPGIGLLGDDPRRPGPHHR